MVNLFVGISKNQIASYEAIVIDNKNSSQTNILITSSTLEANKQLWDEILYEEGSFNNQAFDIKSSFKNITSKINAYKKIIAKLKPYKEEKNLTLYFTYIEDILTNYLLLSFNKHLKGIVVEDGTLNYYHHTITSLSKKKVFLKWLLSNLLGIRFKYYKGHSSGIEYSHVLKQYVRAPELTIFPKKAVQLPYNFKKPKLNNTILIIGQEAYINVYGRKLYEERLTELISIAQNQSYFNSISKVYYKPHRNGERIDYNKYKTKFKNIDFEVLSENEPLEKLYFEKLGSKFIYSFDSSALLNIYLEIDDILKPQIDFNVLLKYNTLLKPVFEKLNFNIYQ